MKKDAGQTPAAVGDDLAERLRWLAVHLRGARSMEQLHRVVENAVRRLPGFDTVDLSAEAAPHRFPMDELHVPLVGASGSLGSMHLPLTPGRSMARSDLRLAGAVADVSAAIIEKCLGERHAGLAAILTAAMDGLSVGVLCFDPAGALLFSNVAARAWMTELPAKWPLIWQQFAPGGRFPVGSSFVFRSREAIIHAVPKTTESGAPCAVVLMDVAPQARLFADQLAMVAYRSLHEKHGLVFGMVSSAEGSTATLEILDALPATLPGGAFSGPLDGETGGVVLPSFDIGAMRRLLAAIGANKPESGIQFSMTSLRCAGENPAMLVSRAREGLEPAPLCFRPEVLVFDRSANVTDSVGLILRNDCAVTAVNQETRRDELLRSRAFEGIILELPQQPDERSLAAIREMIAAQPAAKTFFTSNVAGPWELASFGLPPSPVFRKPFAVRDMRKAISEALEIGGA
ncbi:MAG: hypothetical protein ACREIA_20115 [Opitutaceae bacterium]